MLDATASSSDDRGQGTSRHVALQHISDEIATEFAREQQHLILMQAQMHES